MENCQKCRFNSILEDECILGRDQSKCKIPEARRGDEELINRLMTFKAGQIGEPISSEQPRVL